MTERPRTNWAIQQRCAELFIELHSGAPWAVAKARDTVWTEAQAEDLARQCNDRRIYERKCELREKFRDDYDHEC